MTDNKQPIIESHKKTRARNELLKELESLKKRIAELEKIDLAHNHSTVSLVENRELAKRYFNLTGVMVKIIDRNGNVTFVNKKCCEVLECDEKEIIGKNWLDVFVPQRIRSKMLEYFDKLITGTVRPVEFHVNPVITCRDEEKIIGWHNTLLRDEFGNIGGTLSSGLDLTAGKKAEKELRIYSERLKRLQEFHKDILSARSVKTISDTALAHIRKLIPSFLGAVIEFDFKRKTASVITATFDSKNPMEPEFNFTMPLDNTALRNTEVWDKFKKGEVVIFYKDNLSKELPLIDDFFISAGSRAYLKVPLLVQDDLIGGLYLSSKQVTELSTEQIEIAKEFANSLAIGIQNIRLFESVVGQREKIRSMAKSIQEVEEKQKRWLARELHDQIGQSLTALNLNLNLISKLLPDDNKEKISKRVEDSINLVGDTTRQLREVMHELRPPELDDYGLSVALTWFGKKFSERTNIKLTYQIEPISPRLSISFEMVMFRIAQEALNNVAKHAQAKNVKIELKNDSDRVVLKITDDGIGFDLDNIAISRAMSGWGLITMEERATAKDGEFIIKSEQGIGTEVIVIMKKEIS